MITETKIPSLADLVKMGLAYNVKTRTTSEHLPNLKVECDAVDFLSADDEKKLTELTSKYNESKAHVEKANPFNGCAAHERARRELPPGKTMSVSLEECRRKLQESEAIELHRHAEFYKNQIAPELIPYVIKLRAIAIAAADRDAQLAKQACERIGVPYNQEKDMPYSSRCLYTKALGLEAKIKSLENGDPGLGSPRSVLELA